MRGKPAKRAFCCSFGGITPADAGKTGAHKLRRCPQWDHPRGCGENLHTPPHMARESGSPPRMRGKPFADAFCEPIHGITPADAGKTNFDDWRRCITEDHPRGCGENLVTGIANDNADGSPPRMRGKLFMFPPCFPNKRITPADAGKTFYVGQTHWERRDHPRGCGENPSIGVLMQ